MKWSAWAHPDRSSKGMVRRHLRGNGWRLTQTHVKTFSERHRGWREVRLDAGRWTVVVTRRLPR